MEHPKLILSSIGVTWLGKGWPINLGILYIRPVQVYLHVCHKIYRCRFCNLTLFVLKHKMTRYDTRYIHDDQNDQQDGNSKLFVSNISSLTQENDISDLFSKYGRWAN